MQRKPLDLSTLVLSPGAHYPNGQFCIMEAVAYIAGESWSDSPECACPVIASFLRHRNDTCTDAQRQELVQYIPRLVGSKATHEVELRRAFKCADWAVRVAEPIRLRARGYEEHAQRLEALQPITNVATARTAADVAYAAAAYAAADAADADAAYAAYAYAAAYAAAAAAYAAADTADARINELCHELVAELLDIV